MPTSDQSKKANKYIQDVRNLPLWVQVSFGIFGIFGTLGTLYGAWGTYVTLNQPKSSEIMPISIATSTVNVSAIFSRYNEMNRAIDQQQFLKKYQNVSIYGAGTFDDISGSFGDDNTTYYLHLSIPGSRISCQFSDVDDTVRRRLDLFKASDEVSFLGTFTGSIMFESGRWLIRECKLIN